MKATNLPQWTVLRFKGAWVSRYGSSAVVTDSSVVFTGSHPGHVFKTFIDLTTSNGTDIQWDAQTVRSRLAEAR